MSKRQIEKERKAFLLKISTLAALMLYEMDNAKVNTKEADELRALLEKHIELAYNTEIIRSTNFLQTLENRIDTVIRKTSQEFNIKL